MKRVILLLVMIVASASQVVRGQNVALKTNVLSDAFLNPNLGIELGLAPKWSLDIDGQLTGWKLSDNRRWKHWAVQPEAHYWLCDRFGGHFFGVHAHGGQFNVGGLDVKPDFLGTDFGKLRDTRFQGWFVGGGLSYGYAFVLGKHWNLEAELGIGYSYVNYDQFRCAGCGKKTRTDVTHHYVGITKTAINLVYLF